MKWQSMRHPVPAYVLVAPAPDVTTLAASVTKLPLAEPPVPEPPQPSVKVESPSRPPKPAPVIRPNRVPGSLQCQSHCGGHLAAADSESTAGSIVLNSLLKVLFDSLCGIRLTSLLHSDFSAYGAPKIGNTCGARMSVTPLQPDTWLAFTPAGSAHSRQLSPSRLKTAAPTSIASRFPTTPSSHWRRLW